MKSKFLIFLILLCGFYMGFGQDSILKIPDSLKNKPYTFFLEKSIEKYQDGEHRNAIFYLNVFLKGAKRSEHAPNIVQGYYYLNFLSSDPKIKLQYVDSALNVSQKSKYSDFDRILYSAKGEINYSRGKYSRALDNYLEAQNIAKKEEDLEALSGLEYSIGSVKLRIGNFEEAINHYRSYYSSIDKKNLDSYSSRYYLVSLYGLSYAYQQNKKLDSATYFNNLTIKEAIKYSNRHHFNKAKVNEAIIAFHRKKYDQTIDSILLYLPQIEQDKDSIGLSISNLYLGKAYSKLNQTETAIRYLKITDTIIKNEQIYIRELRENYALLRNFFKEKDDLTKYLVYLEKLIAYDSILNKNTNYLRNTLITKYENPKLFQEKEELIEKLEKSSNKKSIALYITFILISLLLILSSFNYQKRLKYKKRFEVLTTENTTDLSPVILKKSKNHHKKEVLTIPDNVIADVIKKLKVFEKELKFLDSKVTLINLAKSLETNSNYLSKIINHYKEKNFSSYISDLRITYVIQALKEQPKLKEYTIKAIAFEVGFNNVESFTKAFYKKTQLYPSYFIKQLKKRESKHAQN